MEKTEAVERENKIVDGIVAINTENQKTQQMISELSLMLSSVRIPSVAPEKEKTPEDKNMECEVNEKLRAARDRIIRTNESLQVLMNELDI